MRNSVARVTAFTAVTLLLHSLPAVAQKTRPSDYRSGPNLPGKLSSTWGARRFDGSVVPELDYQRFGYLTERGVQNIQRFVEALRPGDDKLVLFRGQKELRQQLSHMPEDRSQWPQIVDGEMQRASQKNNQKIDNLKGYQTLSLLSKDLTRAYQQQMRYYCEAKPLDQLVLEHQGSSGNRLLISATRGLSVAAGDYNMRTSDNRNRYIYVLVAPKDRLVNVYALDKVWGEFHVELEAAKATAKPRTNEKEIAVWVEATDCVAGIYDAVEDKFLTPPGRGAAPALRKPAALTRR